MVDRLVRDEGDAGLIRRDVDIGDGTHAERMVAYNELAVPFFLGKQFRIFYEFSVASGSQQVIKIVSTVNFVIFGVDVDLMVGTLRLTSAAGGSEGGTFSTAIPVMRRNTMTDVPTPVPTTGLTVSTGGTITGQSTLDVNLSSVGKISGLPGSGGAEYRGLAPGTYYLILAASGGVTMTGAIRLSWLER